MNQQKIRAFTLVELIVVITILAILGTIAFISLQGYSQSARDSVRMSDMKNIEKGLTLFQINNGKFPVPSLGTSILFNGTQVWNQGVFGESVFNNIGNIDKIPEDPMTLKKYTYSVSSNRSEFSIVSIIESDIANNNYYQSKIYAGSGNNFSVMVLGNYNGLFTKISTGGLDYILALPSIVTSSTGINLQEILNENKLVFHNGKNLPTNYINSGYNTIKNLNYSLVKNYDYIPFVGNISDLTNNNDIQALFLKKLQRSYSNSYIKNNAIIKSLLLVDSSNINKTKNYVGSLVKNNIGGQKIIIDFNGGLIPSISYNGFSNTLLDGTRLLKNMGNSGENDGLLFSGQGLKFNGTSQYIQTGISDYTGGELSYFFTINIPKRNIPLVSNSRRHITLFNNGIGIAVNDYQEIYFDQNLEYNKYYRIGIVRDVNNKVSIYINGAKQSDTIVQPGEYPLNLIGYKENGGIPYYFEGIMQNIQFFNKAFTDEQVLFDYYNPESSLYLNNEGSLASDNVGVDLNSALLYYPLVEGTGSTVFNVADLNLSNEMFIDNSLDDINGTYSYYSSRNIDLNIKRKGNNSIKYNYTVGNGYTGYIAGISLNMGLTNPLEVGKTYKISIWAKSEDKYNLALIWATTSTSRAAFINNTFVEKEIVGDWIRYEGTPTYIDDTVTGNLIIYASIGNQNDDDYNNFWFDGDISVKEFLNTENIIGYNDNMWLDASGLNYGLQTSLLKQDSSGRLIGLSNYNKINFNGNSYVDTGWISENNKPWSLDIIQYIKVIGGISISGYEDNSSEKIGIGYSLNKTVYIIGNSIKSNYNQITGLHSLILTFDGADKYKIYIDSLYIGEFTKDLLQTNLNFLFGASNKNTLISDFLLYDGGYFKKYDKELSQAEIDSIYENFKLIYPNIRILGE